LYGKAVKVAFALGHQRIGTYILLSEDGASLREAGWKIVAETKGGTWNARPVLAATSTRLSQSFYGSFQYDRLLLSLRRGMASRSSLGSHMPDLQCQSRLLLRREATVRLSHPLWKHSNPSARDQLAMDKGFLQKCHSDIIPIQKNQQMSLL
jgi:hypothetical protein